jgi:4,5-DOPA dioxygenase extradiol
MAISRSKQSPQIVYMSHGGGPLPILGDASHMAMIEFMQQLPMRLHKPDVILVVSAHWEEGVVTLQGARNPAMLYDYYGFPPEAYEIAYPAPGDPDLAKRITDILDAHGIRAAVDHERGYDHGLFIPLKMMYPNADIPCLQISLLQGLDSKAHLELGKTISSLVTENMLVVGSGFSFHNLRAFTFGAKESADARNDAFQDWLIEVCTGNMNREERERLLVEWERAPSARYCHPREEHLLPLHVCMGMAGASAELVFNDYIAGKRALAFLWQ